MKSKDEIKHEIYELAQKISRASSEKFLLESAREIYELVALLKYAPKEEAQPTVTPEEKKATPATEPVKAETQIPATEQKQSAIDLFSVETEQVTAPQPPSTPQVTTAPPVPTAAEKPGPKESKAPKKKKEESVAEKLQHNKITDLKASIGINEKFQFINQLFEGNMKEYNVAIDQINSFSSLSEAEQYIDNLQGVYKWNEEEPVTVNFLELVQRRFA